MFSFLYRNNYKKINLNEFVKHCTSASLWVAIGNKVYDITDYISIHPGGTKCLLANGGQDITYHANFHSKKMKEILKPMLVGELDSTSVRILQGKTHDYKYILGTCC
jgi:cytochrome b involved in lipid metabolism